MLLKHRQHWGANERSSVITCDWEGGRVGRVSWLMCRAVKWLQADGWGWSSLIIVAGAIGFIVYYFVTHRWSEKERKKVEVQEGNIIVFSLSSLKHNEKHCTWKVETSQLTSGYRWADSVIDCTRRQRERERERELRRQLAKRRRKKCLEDISPVVKECLLLNTSCWWHI